MRWNVRNPGAFSEWFDTKVHCQALRHDGGESAQLAEETRAQTGQSLKQHPIAVLVRLFNLTEVDIGASEVNPDLFGYLLQGFQTLRQEHHMRFIDGSHRDGSY
jgi:hypothetical protein